MTSITSITLEVPDLAAAEKFYAQAFELGDRLRLRAGESPSSGFRGYTLSVIASQPSNAAEIFATAIAAGGTVIKPFAKSLWGTSGVLQAPDGAIWKVATSAKKDTGPVTREVKNFVLLLGPDDFAATKKFYVDRGLPVGKSIGKYTEFSLPKSPVTLALLSRKSLAKDAGIAPEGSGSPRLGVTSDLGEFTDPDGVVWTQA
ncbi:MAG TPA: glyoxalase [Pseudolysinimonas sp.]|nr:glyoxalase [Pseudolysinimonas sp.]